MTSGKVRFLTWFNRDRNFMSEIFGSFGGALRDLMHPRMLLLAILPMLGALALWLGLAWTYWGELTHLVDGWLAATALSHWLPVDGFLTSGKLAHVAATVLIALLLIPLVLATSNVAAALLAMPLIVGFVASRRHPELVRRNGGSFGGSVGNSLVATGGFALMWLVTLPLWLVGVLGPPLALILSAWLNQRLFFYDALAEHATTEEYKAIHGATRVRRYLLGVLVAAFYVVPLANLLVPVLCGLAFTRFALSRLAAHRAIAERRQMPSAK